MRNLGLIDLPFSMTPLNAVPTPTNHWSHVHGGDVSIPGYWLTPTVGTVRLGPVPGPIVDGGWQATTAQPLATEAVLAGITGNRSWAWWMSGLDPVPNQTWEVFRTTEDPPWGWAMCVKAQDTGWGFWPVFDWQSGWPKAEVFVPWQYQPMMNGNWRHWTISWNLTTQRVTLFWDGVQIAQWSGCDYAPAKKTMSLKWPGTVAGGTFSAYVSDVRAFASELSPNEALAIFRGGRQQI